MRLIKIYFGCRHDVYIRRASEDGSWVEIQGQYGGIVVQRPALRRTVRHGLVLVDHDPSRRGIAQFTDRTRGFERNDYAVQHYRVE